MNSPQSNSSVDSPISTGTLRTWFEIRRFGFLQPDGLPGEANSVFIHANDFAPQSKPYRGARVQFRVVVSQGRAKAIEASIIPHPPLDVIDVNDFLRLDLSSRKGAKS